MKRLLLMVLLVFFPSSAQAFRHCQTPENAARVLNERHKEAPVAQGVTVNGAFVQVWRTADGKTWTITIRIPGGPVCLLQSGDDWREIPFKLPGAGA